MRIGKDNFGRVNLNGAAQRKQRSNNKTNQRTNDKVNQIYQQKASKNRTCFSITDPSILNSAKKKLAKEEDVLTEITGVIRPRNPERMKRIRKKIIGELLKTNFVMTQIAKKMIHARRDKKKVLVQYQRHYLQMQRVLQRKLIRLTA